MSRWTVATVGALSLLAACGPSGPPTWSNGVGELVHAECAGCHRPQGPGPFSLLRYEGAARRAEDLAEMVSARTMPPWLPSPDGPHMADPRLLTPEQIDLIVAWAAAGAPEGNPNKAPVPPVWPSGWALGEPDLVVSSGDVFQVPAEGGEIFRNLVLPANVDRPRWVRAIELRPGNPQVVHHATIRVDRTSASRLADARDTLPGFDDMFSRTEARPPGGFFLGWTPGRLATPYSNGMAWSLEPGADLVVQLHLRPTGDPAEASVELGLYFTDVAPTEMPLIVRLGGQEMDIPAGEAEYEVLDELVLPVSVSALGVYPHAHYLGREMDAWGVTPEGDSIPLLDIPRWDFNWQDAYRYAAGIRLPAGTVLKMRYTFDNSDENPLNPFESPRRIVYGPTSGDEMAEFWLQVLPDSPSDGAQLSQALAAKHGRDRVAGWRHLLAMNPSDPESLFGLGSEAQARGNYEEALALYSRALAVQPDYAQVLYNTGLIREEEGEAPAAARLYERAVASLPQYPAAWSNLGRLRAGEGDLTGARAALERAVAADSTHVEAQNNLGSVLSELGMVADAERHYRASILAAPDFAPARFNLSLLLVSLGQGEEALLELNRALSLDGANVQAALAVGWALATEPNEAFRRPDLAADLAGQVSEITGPHPAVLDVQAAAFAASGRFLDAVSLVDQAIAESRLRGETERLPDLMARRDLYRAKRPFVRLRR